MGVTIKPKIKAEIKNNQLVVNTKIQGKDRFVFITIKELDDKRTLAQNNFYWLYLNIISEELGDDPNSLHEFFKRKFLRPKIIEAMGKRFKVPASTTRLGKLEFGEYLDRICALTEVPIPDTEEFKQLVN